MTLVRRILATTHHALACTMLAGGLLATFDAAALDSLKIIVPAAPGGGWDQPGRALGRRCRPKDRRADHVDNKGGAGGTIGLAQFNSNKGDPNAMMVTGKVMVCAVITNKSPVTLTQVTPIARLTGEYGVLVVPGTSKMQNMADLVAKYKASPGNVSWGGGSAGGVDQFLAGMIVQAVGVRAGKFNYIAFTGGGEALAATMGGHVTVGMGGYSEFAAQIKSGKLRALAHHLATSACPASTSRR